MANLAGVIWASPTKLKQYIEVIFHTEKKYGYSENLELVPS